MDHFNRKGKIGKGTFGDILLVEKKSDKRLFALKRVPLNVETNNTKISAVNEIKVLQALEHPNIIKYYDSFVWKNKLCILMEFAEGGDLSKYVKEAKNSGNFITEDLIMNWFCQICLALKYLHDCKILHRDIKVQNIFITKAGIVKLGDFGISKQLESTFDLAQTSLGTPYYLSPEICTSSSYNHMTDIWMLGCALHELCSLEKPFPGDSLNAVIQKIMNEPPRPIPERFNENIRNLISNMLSKNPNDRLDINNIIIYPYVQKQMEKFKEKNQDHFIRISELKENQNLSNKKQAEGQKVLVKSGSFNNEQQKQTFSALTSPVSSQSVRTPMSDATKERLRQNSIHFIIEKAKQQSSYSQSPGLINQKFLIRNTEENKNLIIQPSFQKKITFEDSESFVHSNQTIGSIDSIIIENKSSKDRGENKYIDIDSPNKKKDGLKNLNESPSDESTGPLESSGSSSEQSFTFKGAEIAAVKPKKPYQREISINTAALDSNFPKKTLLNNQGLSGFLKTTPKTSSSSSSKISPNVGGNITGECGNEKNFVAGHSSTTNKLITNNIPTDKGRPKTFSFAGSIFNPKVPVSPNRTYLFNEFLKERLGEEKLNKVRYLLESSNNPMSILEDKKRQVIDIIGEENSDCIKIFKFLISSSATPTTINNIEFKKNNDFIFKEGSCQHTEGDNLAEEKHGSK